MTQLSDAEIAELERLAAEVERLTEATLAEQNLVNVEELSNRREDAQLGLKVALLRNVKSLIAAAKAQRGDGWRTMESAPKDGTEFMAYSQDKTGSGLPPFISQCAWHPDAGFCTDELREPTHWRPLPAPPSPQETE